MNVGLSGAFYVVFLVGCLPVVVAVFLLVAVLGGLYWLVKREKIFSQLFYVATFTFPFFQYIFFYKALYASEKMPPVHFLFPFMAFGAVLFFICWRLTVKRKRISRSYGPRALADGLTLYYINFFPWDEMGDARRVSIFGLPYIKVLLNKSASGYSAIWIPLYITDLGLLRGEIHRFAPPENCLRKLIDEVKGFSKAQLWVFRLFLWSVVALAVVSFIWPVTLILYAYVF